MPQPKQTREQRLAQFKISLDRYQMECRGLVSEGFSPEQADRLIIRGSSYKTVQSVLNNCRDLLVAPYHLTQEQLTTIAGHDGGSKNIEALKAAFCELQTSGFTAAQIVRIAGHDGGSKNIEAVKAAFCELQTLGFTAVQIVTIAGNKGGSKNIEAVKAAFCELQTLGFTAAQIVTIAGHIGGSKNIEAVQRYFQELRVKGHSMESIAAIASRNGGSGAIRSAVAHDFRAFLVSLGAIPTTNTIMPLASMRLFSSRDDASLSANADDDEPMDSPQPNKRRKFSTNGVRLD